MVVDHLSVLIYLENKKLPLDEYFLGDKIFVLIQDEVPWYANFVNYLASEVLPLDMNYQHKKKLFEDLKYYYWDEPLIFKRGANIIF